MNSLHPGPEITARVEQMLDKLKEKKFRITPQRVAILRILAGGDHPSVDKVFEQIRAVFPTTSIATVYKTVSLLKEMGEVLELGFPDGSNRYDGSKPYSHPHVICTKCRKILDPELSSLGDLTREVVRETGFSIISHRLDFFGTCRECWVSGDLTTDGKKNENRID